MISQQQISAFLRKISEDDELAEFFASRPEGTLVPFRKSPVDYFFATSFALWPSDISRAKLVFVCTRIVGQFIEERITTGLKAIDVLVCAKVGDEFERVMRFSVSDVFFEGLPSLSPDDLLQKEPVTGIRVGWYWQASEVPAE